MEQRHLTAVLRTRDCPMKAVGRRQEPSQVFALRAVFEIAQPHLDRTSVNASLDLGISVAQDLQAHSLCGRRDSGGITPSAGGETDPPFAESLAGAEDALLLLVRLWCHNIGASEVGFDGEKSSCYHFQFCAPNHRASLLPPAYL